MPNDHSQTQPLNLPTIPNLVIKVANSKHQDSLAKEAAIYDEMESIQGIAVPRCYGFFETELAMDDGWSFSDVDNRSSTSSSQTGIISVLLLERLGGPPALLKKFDDEER